MSVISYDVSSSSLLAVQYDSDAMNLRVAFHPSKGGDIGIYDYSNVTEFDFDSLMKAPSIGSYFAKEIKGKKGQFSSSKVMDANQSQFEQIFDSRQPHSAYLTTGQNTVQPNTKKVSGFIKSFDPSSKPRSWCW